MRSDLLWSLSVAAAFAAACSESAPPPGAVPASLSVAPSVGFAGAAVPVVISGTGFLAKATQPQGGGDPVLDTQTRAWLGSTELTGVTWLGTTTLNATVPAGLAPGTHDLTVENALGNLGTAKGAYTVLAAPPFSATATVDHATVSVGQTLTLTVTVTNGGSDAIDGFQLGAPTVSSSDGGSARPLSARPPAPAAIAAGERVAFTWTYAPTTPGHVSIAVELTGVDAASGAAVTAALAAPAEALIQLPAALTATWIGRPSTQQVDFPVSLTLELTNAVGAATANVTSVTPSMSPATNGSCTAAAPATTAAAPVQIAGGASQRFIWSCTAAVFGDYLFGAAVAASDLNSGGPLSVLPTAVNVHYTTDLVLTVVLQGNGSGTVTSTPAGITGCESVGGTCSALFPIGTLVTLSAAPATGSTLSWAGCTPTTGNPNHCTVTMDGAKKVTATFTVNRYTVGGSVSGLAGSGHTLQDNGGDDLAVASNGAFVFKTPIARGGSYAVTVRTQPSSPSQTCTVRNGSGIMPGANVTNVNVSCVTNTFTVGGSVSGLAGSGLTLRDNGRDDLAVASNGTFVFKTPIASGGTYAVTVKTQPKSPRQTCTVTNGGGVMTSANVTNVAVSCR